MSHEAFASEATSRAMEVQYPPKKISSSHTSPSQIPRWVRVPHPSLKPSSFFSLSGLTELPGMEGEVRLTCMTVHKHGKT